MYASGEPCPMCLAAMHYAWIDKVYYCASVKDAVDAGLGEAQVIYNDLQKTKTERTLPMIQISLNEGQEDPMKLWKERR